MVDLRFTSIDIRKTIILDLDETLAHCTHESKLHCEDLKVNIFLKNGQQAEGKVKIRPHARELIIALAPIYEIIIFTASQREYADKVIDIIDPQNLIKKRLYREHCIRTPEGVHIKDLRIIKNRELQNIIIVDNSLYCFGFQLANGIPILPYYGQDDDIELIELQGFLLKLSKVNNTQIFIQSYFSYKKYVELADNQALLIRELIDSIGMIETLFNSID